MTFTAKYFEEPKTDLVVINTTVDGSNENPHFKIIYGNKDNITTLEFNWNTLTQGIKVIIYYQKSESLLIEAVRNFIRKINFAELNENLEDEEITEETYLKELEQNSNKYAITLKNISSQNDVIIMTDLMQKIGTELRDFTTSEVSEMFSIKEKLLVDYIYSICKKLK